MILLERNYNLSSVKKIFSQTGKLFILFQVEIIFKEYKIFYLRQKKLISVKDI